MSFSRQYFALLLLVPAAVGLPTALLFLTQVEQLSPQQWLTLHLLIVVLYTIGATLFVRRVAPHVAETEAGLRRAAPEVPDLLSRCLRKTVLGSNWLWLVGGFAFTVAATLLVATSMQAFRHFAVAAMIAGGPAVVWNYAAAKQLLVRRAGAQQHLRYAGRHRLTVSRKIAIVFIGFFVISSLATVQLVSVRVSKTLEKVAIDRASDVFSVVYPDAAASPTLSTMNELRRRLPSGYDLFLLDPAGTLVSIGVPLDEKEIREIRRMRSGNSRAFSSANVSLFRQTPNGSIVGLLVPWEQYSGIPFQIAGYTMVVAILTTVLFIAATFWLSRDVKEPLKELRRAGAELARGNFTAEHRIFADDEIGDLADSFAETRENLRRLMSRIGGSGTVISDGVHVITGGTGALLTRSRDQAELTAQSGRSVESVRSGINALVDSAQKVTDATHDTSGRALELHASAEEIAGSMDYLFQSVEKSSASTTEMNASAVEMSRRTDVLAAIGEDVLGFVGEMDSMVEELRQNSEATAEISREVREAAASGGKAVEETVAGIHLSQGLAEESARVLDELQSSVGKIDHILRVIEDVTEQTNLLALNASIIAAQAGEHGRSFNVVAGEIRQLAERTRGSTKQIGEIIGAVQESASGAVRAMTSGVDRAYRNVALARNASESLQIILSSADRSHEMSSRISAALRDQAQASRHLHEVTSRMSDHILEINRSTGEQARGTQLLAEEAERVREIALQVRTSTDQQSIASRGISAAMEEMAAGAALIHDLLQQQLAETEQIARASQTMLQIARDNDAVAQEFNGIVETLVRSGDDFQAEVGKFRL